MMNIGEMPLGELLQQSFKCHCGRVHETNLESVIIASGALTETAGIIKDNGWNNVFVIADTNTWEAAGKDLVDHLKSSGLNTTQQVFDDAHLVPDEHAIGRVLMRLHPEVDIIVGVGAGTINDMARFVSFRLKLPYIIVATAPSMDGYASSVAPLITNNLKTTYECHTPAAVIADLDIIAKAPQAMIAAGFGDILGKYTCLLDWKLSAIINDEYYCETVVSMMRAALEKTVSLKHGLASRDKEAVGKLMEALILAGVAMSYVGNSRPASGSEHHLAHFWEMHMLFEGRPPALHGAKVGIATGLVLEMYECLQEANIGQEFLLSAKPGVQPDWEEEIRRVFRQGSGEVLALEQQAGKNDLNAHKLRMEKVIARWDQIQEVLQQAPSAREVRKLLEEVGGPTQPEQVELSPETVLDSIKYAKEIRARYTVLQLLWDLGLLQTYAKRIVGLE